jgi:hypothetical protein
VKERDRLEDLDVDGKVILKWILRKEDEVMRTGFVCSKKGPSRGILYTWHYTFGFLTCLEFRVCLRNSQLPGSSVFCLLH